MLALLAVGLAAPLLAAGIGDRLASRRPVSWRVLSASISAALGIGFWVFRARSHFLGDGYQNLARFAVENPHPKFTSLGVDRILIALRHLDPEPAAGALLAYQSVSVLAGIAYVLLASWFATRHFPATAPRLAFLLGLTSCGSVLLFFGYVESYALPVAGMLATSLLALASFRGEIRRGWIVPVFGASVFLHVLGLVMLPGVLFALWHDSSWSRAVRRWPRIVTGAIVLLAAGAAGAAAVVAFRSSLFLRLAFVPVVPGRFTVDGYTSGSAAHVADWLNLAFVMLPSLPILALSLKDLPFRTVLREPAYRYLAISLAATAAASWLLDPKLGMPRDWDLFAPFGLHLALASFHLLADRWRVLTRPFPVAAIAIALNGVVLGGRVATGMDPAAAVRRFEAHLTLDRTKSSNSRIHLVNYFRSIGDEPRAQQEIARWNEDYPERSLVRAAHRLRLDGRLDESIAMSRRALELNPVLYDAYTNLGAALLAEGDVDGAIEMLGISDGLNPGDLFVALNLGDAHFRRGDLTAAEKWWRKARSLDPGGYHANRALAELYARQKRPVDSRRHLEAAAASPQAQGEALVRLGDLSATLGDSTRAMELYRKALATDLEPAAAQTLRERYPALR